MPLPNWLSGGFQAAKSNANKAYGTVDSALGGFLPGGSDSPYIGQSSNPRKQEKALQFAREYVAGNLTAMGIEKVGHKANELVDRFRKSTQVPYSSIENARRVVLDRLSPGSNLNLVRIPSNQGEYFNRIGEVGLRQQPVFGPGPSGLQIPKGYTTSAPIALHELGHALNFDQKSSSQLTRNRLYGSSGKPGQVATLSSARGFTDENRGLFQAGIEGALSNLFSPGTRHTLVEEGLASARAIRLAKELGLPQGKRLLGSAFTTYAAPPLSTGFAEGFVGELASRGTKLLGDTITDKIIDPIADKIRGNEYTPLEEKLRKYGYEESKHRLRSKGMYDPIEIELK